MDALTEYPQAAFAQALAAAPERMVFVTISGAHLYGFPSQDSDFDLRGSHVLPGDAFWSLDVPRETVELAQDTDAGLVETVSHDIRKYARLLLKRNGYVLEQLTSPLVVHTTPAHTELLALVPGLLTRNHYHHYRGFYYSERKEYERSEPRSIKKLLYCYRVLMTGCVLLREGLVEANLPALNQRFGLDFLNELVGLKASGERVGLADDRPYVGELERLEQEMERAYSESTLPEQPSVREELNQLVIRLRREA